MVRIGLVGLGFMGKVHLGAYNKLANAQVVAVADRDARRAAGDLSEKGADNISTDTVTQLDMNTIKGTTDPMELIAMADVDMVDICVPTPFHKDIAIAALKAGKHVLCEKPLARTLADAEAIAQAAEQASSFFMPAMCMRFWPQWAWLKKTIDEGTYGKVKSAFFRRAGQMPGGWYSNGDWSGGAILDLHIHDSDFVQFVFGKPKAVTSQGYSKTSGQIDHITTMYHFDKGQAAPFVVAEGGWCFADGYGFRMAYTVNFENASVDFDIARKDQLILYTGGTADPIHTGDATDGYGPQIRYFLECIENKQKPTRITAADGLQAVRIVEAERQSIEQGKTVDVG